MTALRPSLPSTSRGCSCAAPLVVAACCTPARVCTRLSSCSLLAAPSCAPVSAAAPPQRLQRCKRFCISLFKLSSRLNQSPRQSPRAAPAVPAARPQPPVLSVPCGADRRPAGDRQGVRGRARRPPPARGGRGGRWKGSFNFPIPSLQPCRQPVPSHPSCLCLAARTGGLLVTARACGAGCAGHPQHGVGAVVGGKVV